MRNILYAAAVALAIAGSPARADTRTVTFKDAIDLALGKNPDVAAAKGKVDSASEKVSELKSNRLPNVRLNFDGRAFTEPYKLPFGKDDKGNDVIFTLHEQFTTTTVASITQPLTGLAYLSEVVGAANHAVAASKADYDRTRLDVAYRTAEGYVRTLEARAQAEVARASVADIGSELDRAEKLRAADTYTDVDVLRFRSAKAAADQTLRRAETASQQALAGLVVQIGLHDGDAIDVVDDLPQAPALAMTVEQAQERALKARPELVAAQNRLAAANRTRTAARETYVPDVRAVGAWVHATGVQPFQPEDEEYLGVTLSWNVWDWGATHHKVEEARRDVELATIEAGAVVDRVKLDVRSRWLDAKAGYENLASAQTQVDSAEAAMKLQRVRFEAGAATTTDVLDAETDLARGRTQAAVARYDYYLALVALARAMGDLPST